MNREREYIRELCSRMTEGKEMAIARGVFQDAYPSGWPSIYNNSMEAFLSSMIGSAWGVWTVRQDFETGNYVIGRHREGNRRVYIDPDRAYLFKKDADGYLIPRSNT